jgi:arylformamidase
MPEAIIDISVLLSCDMPVWPGSTGYSISQVLDMEKGDVANICRLTMDAHVGTHIDAPWHFLKKGPTVEHVDLSRLVGPAEVVYLPQVDAITAAVLDTLQLRLPTRRLLFRTRNSQLWKRAEKSFEKNFVAFTADGAQWIIDHAIEVVGVDYLSVQRFYDPSTTHELLLGNGVVVVEGLNLADVEPGIYEFICLPLKIAGGDGAPARAILRPIVSSG